MDVREGDDTNLPDGVHRAGSGGLFPAPPPGSGVDGPTGARRWGLIAAIGFMLLGAAMMVTGVAIVLANYAQYTVPSKAMTPTLDVGDRIVIRKAVGGDVQRGDIVAFDGTAWSWVHTSGAVFVKRVVGVGGDTVRCCDEQGRITVNDLPVDEPYLNRAGDGEQSAPFSAQVPHQSVFVLGDFRARSSDSRLGVANAGSGQGSIPVGDIEGILVAVNFKPVAAPSAFTDAGLPATREGDVLQWPVFYGIVGGAVLAVLGLIGLVTGLLRRSFSAEGDT